MTNKYLVKTIYTNDLGVAAEVMAHADQEALELGLNEINDNHNLYLRLDEVEIINDEMVESNHNLTARLVLEAIQEACPGLFIYRQESLGKDEDEDVRDED